MSIEDLGKAASYEGRLARHANMLRTITFEDRESSVVALALADLCEAQAVLLKMARDDHRP